MIRKTFYPPASSPKAHTSQGWAILKPGFKWDTSTKPDLTLLLFTVFFLQYIFLNLLTFILFERYRVKEREKLWAKTKLRVRDSIWVPHVSGRGPGACATTCCLPGMLEGSWIQSREAGTHTGTRIIPSGNLTLCATRPALTLPSSSDSSLPFIGHQNKAAGLPSVHLSPVPRPPFPPVPQMPRASDPSPSCLRLWPRLLFAHPPAPAPFLPCRGSTLCVDVQGYPLGSPRPASGLSASFFLFELLWAAVSSFQNPVVPREGVLFGP